MDRRQFLHQSSLLTGAAALGLTGCNPNDAPDFEMGYQLFSIREDMDKAPLETLAALKAMGYRHFEAYNFDEKNGAFYGLPAAELRRRMDDMDLAMTSAHFGLFTYLERPVAELERYVDQCIGAALALGMRYVTWPWLAPEQRTLEHFKLLTGRLNLIGERVTAAGLGFAYHNHDFEFVDHGGVTGYDLILRETDPALVKLQLDMYWVAHGGKTTPAAMIAADPGRYVMWHIKDMHKISRDYTELGNGSIDYAAILPDPKTSGLELFYIEQGGNYTHSAMRSARDSAVFFEERLRSFLR